MGKGDDDRGHYHEDRDHEDRGDWFGSHDSEERQWHGDRDDDDDKLWNPKPDNKRGMMGADKQTGDQNADDENGMSDHMKMKIIAGCIVAAVVLIAALIIIVVCCKKRSKKACASSALKKKNPFQNDPEKAMQKPVAKEIEAMQSAPPMLHALPVVIRPLPAVVLGPIPTGQKEEKTDYTLPPPENPRDHMAIWSPPPAYEEEMAKAD